MATLCRSLFFEVMALKSDSFLIVLSSSSVHPNFNRITWIYELGRYFYTSTKLKIPIRFHICGKQPLKSRTVLDIYLWRFNWAASENNFKAVSIRFLIRSRKIALTQNDWLHREKKSLCPNQSKLRPIWTKFMPYGPEFVDIKIEILLFRTLLLYFSVLMSH